MILKWPLIGGLLLLVIARWWARRSTPVRCGLLTLGWLGVVAQAGSAAHQTWGNPADKVSPGAVLGAWVMSVLLGVVIFWFHRDTRPDPADPPAPRRSQQGHRDHGKRRTGSTARNAGKALRSLLGEDRKR